MKARKERAKARLETGEAAPTKKTIESMRKMFDMVHIIWFIPNGLFLCDYL